MERNVIKEGNCENNECNLVTKSSISPRSVEFVSAIEKQETGKCRHFSIRGYVAEIRRKDRKICWPFSSAGDDKQPGEQTDMLPPLHVSEFRWWDCQNCLRNSGAFDAATETRVAPHSSEGNIGKGRKADGGTSVDVFGDECFPIIGINKKEKVADVMISIKQDVFTSGEYDNSAEKDMNKAIRKPTCSKTKGTPSMETGERFTRDAGNISVSSKTDRHWCNISDFKTAVASETATLSSKGRGLSKFCKPNCEIREVEVGFGIKNLNCASNSSAEICQKGKPGLSMYKSFKMSEQQREFMTFSRTPEPVNVENEVLNSVISHTSKLHSLEFNESDDNKDVDSLHDQHQASKHGDSSGTLHHRKTQKVRLLTDIIRSQILGASSKITTSNGIENCDQINSKVTQTKDTLESSGLGLHTVPKIQKPVQENVGKNIMGKKKKRKKTPKDEDCESLLMIGRLKSALENARISKGDEETNCIGSGIANSELVSDACVGMGLHSGFENHLSENIITGKLIQNKKKNKKPRVEDGGSSFKRRQEGFSRKLQFMTRDVEIKRTGDETVRLRSALDASNGRGLHPFLKSHAAAQKYDRKSIFDWQTLTPQQEGIAREEIIRSDVEIINQVGVARFPFKSAPDAVSGSGIHLGLKSNKVAHRKAVINKMQTNMPQVEGGGSSLISRVVNVKCTGTGNVPFKAAQDTSTARGLHTSVKCYMATQRNDKNSTSWNNKTNVPQVEGGKMSQLPWQEGMPKEDQVRSKDVEIKHAEVASMPLKYAPDAFPGRGVPCCLQSSKVALRKAGVSKKQNDMSRVESEVSPLWAKDLSCKCNYENTNYENTIGLQGNSGVIKNDSAERTNKACEPEALDEIAMEIVELLAKNRHERRLLEAEDANKFCLSETTKNVKNAVTMEVTGVLENEKFRLLQEKNSHIQKPQSSNAGAGISSTGSLEKLSTGNQFAAGSGRNFGVQSCRCNGDMLGHSWSLTCLQSLEAHPTCQIVSQQFPCKETHHVFPSNVANFPSGTERTRKFTTNLQEQSENSDFEIFRRINAEYPVACTQKGNGKYPKGPKLVGSLDLYTNETIPAVHLLRLMDAGLSSRASVYVGENQKFPKQPSFTHNNHCKELSPLEDGAFKISNVSKHTLSDYFGRNQSVGKFCEHFSLGSPFNAVAFSVQRDDNFRTSGLTGQVSEKEVSHSVKSRRKKRTKDSYTPMQTTDLKLCGSASGSDGSIRINRDTFSIHDPKKGFLSDSDSMMFPLQSHLVQDSVSRVEMNKKIGRVWPVKNSCGTEICSVNRNPADFSVPEAGNEFMIGGGNSKPRKMILNRDRRGLINRDGHKRRRVMKL